jgi:HORMA domain
MRRGKPLDTARLRPRRPPACWHRADTKPTRLPRPLTDSILYQRGVYPPESFQQRKQYGLSVMVTADDKLAKYLATVLEHVQG